MKTSHSFEKAFACLGVWLVCLAGNSAQPIADALPTVTRHLVNDGFPQRSTVTNISFTLSTNVQLIVSNLVVQNLTTGTINPTNFALSYQGALRMATWTFPGLLGRRLPDGNYTISLLANAATNTLGRRLDGNGDGEAGGAYTFELFSYSGDFNGDRDVDFLDNYWFQRSFETTAVPALKGAFDFNADGAVDTNDVPSFVANYFRILAAQPGIFAALVNDTGPSPWDNITGDPTIAGTVVSTNLITRFLARLEDTNGPFADVTSILGVAGGFRFDSNRLAQIKGTELVDGLHTLHLRTVGAAYAVNAAFALRFTLDVGPPDTFFTFQPPSLSPSNSATFSFNGSDTITPSNRMAFQCRFSPNPAAPWSNCVSPVEVSNLPDGSHTFQVRAVDELGNVDPTPASYTWVVDTTPPPLSLQLDPAFDTPPLGDNATTNPVVTLLAQTEPSLTVTLKNLSANAAPNSVVAQADLFGRVVFTNVSLASGTNLFAAETADLAGNKGATAVSITLTNETPCVFDTAWHVNVSAPNLPASPTGANMVSGSVAFENCVALMNEGDSFLVTLDRFFDTPAIPSRLAFTYAQLNFDTTTSGAIKDAFEVAIVDDNGNPFTHQFAVGRDAFFNESDGQPPIAATGATTSSSTPGLSTVRISLTDLSPGQRFKLIFRLVNNDRDHRTTVRISDVRLEDSSTGQLAGMLRDR